MLSEKIKKLVLETGLGFMAPALLDKANVYIKDLDGKVLWTNQHQLDSFAIDLSPDEMVGYKTSDFNLCDEDHRDLIRKNDEFVIATESPHIFYEPGIFSELGFKRFLSIKMPFYYEDELVGLAGLSIELPEVSNQSNSRQDFVKKYNLSKREELTLAHMLQGCSAAQIAEMMSLSKRTIESRIISIKHKTRTENKRALISLALAENFLGYVA